MSDPDLSDWTDAVCRQLALATEERDPIISAFSQLPSGHVTAALQAGLILADISTKAATEYFRVAPQLLPQVSPEQLNAWVGMGIPLAKRSAATATKFFRQGPHVFSLISDPSLQDRFLKQGTTLSNHAPHLLFEYAQQAPALLNRLTSEQFQTWIEQAIALGQQDYTLAVEYFQVSPALLQALPIDLLHMWVAIILRIQPLYATLTFVRMSPNIFAQLSHPRPLLSFIAELALHASASVQKVMESAVAVLSSFDDPALVEKMLSHATQIAGFNAEIAVNFFLHSAKALRAVGESHKFAAWMEEGLALLRRDPNAASSFFSLESKGARETIDRLRGSVSLVNLQRALQLFARALCGRPVKIASAKALSEPSDAPTTDGETIYLPDHIGYFLEPHLNADWYKIATAFQAGFLEYGTFDPVPREAMEQGLSDRLPDRALLHLTDFLASYPHISRIRALFEIAEGARVECRLKQEYPGLRMALLHMRKNDLDASPKPEHAPPERRLILWLRQIALGGTEAIPSDIQGIVFEACRIMGAVQSLEATVATSMQAAGRVYRLFWQTDDPIPESPMEPLPSGEKSQGNAVGNVMRLATRGVLNPAWVKKGAAHFPLREALSLEKLKHADLGADPNPSLPIMAPLTDRETGKALSSMAEREAMNDGVDAQSDCAVLSTHDYDEWNELAQDYRVNWCHVIERAILQHGEDDAPVNPILTCINQGAARLIMRAFEFLKPEGRIRKRGVSDGDAFDLDRLIESRVIWHSGRVWDDRIYIAHRKVERSVAAAFLIDLSGSTGQQLPSGKTVLQIEKEALILLARAISILGDAFALYGFSGQGRGHVDFYTMKAFEEKYNSKIDRRICNLVAGMQNRDGAAIRHAASKLISEPARTKTLILISDGKPLDEGYQDDYAFADVGRALHEAKACGIHTFCVTVDRAGGEYLERMYGRVAYTVIDCVDVLPTTLPRLYKRLTT